MLAMVALLKEYNIELNAENKDLYLFTISISTGEINFNQIVEWLRANATEI